MTYYKKIICFSKYVKSKKMLYKLRSTAMVAIYYYDASLIFSKIC